MIEQAPNGSFSMKWRHVAVLASILAVTSLLYAHVTTSYFCGYDDFLDVQRAEFVDQIHPSKIFTTTHYGSFKYRPLQRLSNLLSYLAWPKEALWFRVRNLFFHELCAVTIYWLGLLLFDSWAVGAVAAALFAVHPMANQPILQAVGGNPLANFLFLSALALFLLADKRRSGTLLCLSLFCGSVALYGYESSIVLLGIMLSWWGITYLRTRRLPDRRMFVLFALAGALLFGSYLLVRQHFTRGAITPVFGPAVVLKGIVQYCGAVLLPVDVVLAHTWFGTPLPSQVDAHRLVTIILWPALAIAALAGIIGIKFRAAIANLLPPQDWDRVLFLLLASLFAIFPFLVFTEHVSETYITLPIAFYCLALSRLLACIRRPAAKWAVVGTLVALSCCATSVRNGRVSACASTARQILSNLSSPAFRQGEWRINLAKAPGQIALPRYGLYNYAGLDTIGTGAGGTGDYGLRGVESALQIVTGNPELSVHVFETAELPGQCRQRSANEVCYFVNPDNTIAQFR